MRSPYEILADIITKRPAFVILFLVALIFTALIGTTLITMETGSSTYMDKDTKRGMLLDTYSKTFQSDNLMVLIEADDVLDPEIIAYMDRLDAQIASQRYVTGTNSIAGMMKQLNGGTLPQSSAEFEAMRAKVPDEAFTRYVPSRLMTINVVTLEPGLSQDVQDTVLNNINSVIAFSEPPIGVSVVVTGEPAFQQQMGQEMGESMGTLILIAMVLMVVAVGFFFSHVRYRFLPVVIVASGLILTFGIIGFAGIPISMVAIAAFPVLIGIGIDYAINIHARFDEEARRSPLPEAVRTTLTKSGPSILYAMISTSMGFIALWISPVPMIRSFGLVCVIGVASCYLMALLMVPAVGILLKYRPKYGDNSNNGQSGEESHLMEQYNMAIGNLASRIVKVALPVLLICAIIGFIGFEMDNEVIINTNEDTFVPQDMPARVDLEKVSRTIGSTSSIPIYVRADNVLSIETLEWMWRFQQYEQEHNDKITGSSSIASFVMEYNNGEMPVTKAELDAVLEKIPQDQKARYVSGSTDAVILFSTVDMENEVAMAMIDNLRKELAWNEPPPGVSVSVTGMGEMFTNLIREITIGKMQMTILAFILIFTFLLIIYRNILKAATPVIPIMMIVGWNGLVMYILGIDYTPMTATLGSMTIGVASEYTILIMERYYEERERGFPVVDAICQATRQIGTAITVSGMTTVFGFAALLASSFNMISNFGLVTVITVGFSLIGAIIVMPAILVIIGRFDRRGLEGAGHD